jgi:Uma2 family endonuclease
MSIAPSEVKLVLGLDSAGMLMTPEEFDAVEDWDEEYRYELVHGVLVVTAIPLPMETGPNEMLGHLLLAHRETHPQGKVLDLTLPEQIVRTRDGRRRADRLIWAGLGRTPHLKRDVPSAAVEFVSAGRRSARRDYVEKRHDYMELGIGEFWIIDRFRRTLTVYRNRPEGPEEIIIAERETYRPPFLPGFELDLARLLAVADQMDEAVD